MFDNIGQKIKTVAKIITWVFIGFSVLVGICTFRYSLIAGLLVILIGSALSWVGSFLLYGIGELIDSTQRIQADLYNVVLNQNTLREDMLDLKILVNQKKTTTTIYKTTSGAGDDKIYCNKCGKANIASLAYCSGCGSKLQKGG